VDKGDNAYFLSFVKRVVFPTRFMVLYIHTKLYQSINQRPSIEAGTSQCQVASVAMRQSEKVGITHSSSTGYQHRGADKKIKFSVEILYKQNTYILVL